MAYSKTSLHTTIPRFTVRDGYKVWSMDVLDTGRLAVAGGGNDITFIDLFKLDGHADSKNNPLLLTSEPYYSKEFTKFALSWRSVCLLANCRFLTCCEDTIASYDSSKDCLVEHMVFQKGSKAMCMTTKDDLVYVSFYESKEVIVLGLKDLQITKTITLRDLNDRYHPWEKTFTKLIEAYEYVRDITVSNNKLCICTVEYGRVLKCNSNGDMEQECRNKQKSDPWSITVSEENGFIFTLWGDDDGSRQVVVYGPTGSRSSISRYHSIFNKDDASIYGGHILASFKVPDNSLRIRINNNINRLFVVTETTGEVYEFDTRHIFFYGLLTSSEYLIEKDDCHKLLDYLKVPAKESKDIIESDAPFSSLVHCLREARF